MRVLLIDDNELVLDTFDVRLTKPVEYQLFTQHLHAFALTRSLLR